VIQKIILAIGVGAFGVGQLAIADVVVPPQALAVPLVVEIENAQDYSEVNELKNAIKAYKPTSEVTDKVISRELASLSVSGVTEAEIKGVSNKNSNGTQWVWVASSTQGLVRMRMQPKQTNERGVSGE